MPSATGRRVSGTSTFPGKHPAWHKQRLWGQSCPEGTSPLPTPMSGGNTLRATQKPRERESAQPPWARQSTARCSFADLVCTCREGFVGDGYSCNGKLPEVLADHARFSTFYSVSNELLGPWCASSRAQGEWEGSKASRRNKRGSACVLRQSANSKAFSFQGQGDACWAVHDSCFKLTAVS